MTVLQRTPTNTDLLQTTKYRVTFDRLPGATYFCQAANVPGVSLTEVPFATPFIDLFVPGEKMIYDTFNITFLIDEDMRAWTELHDWIRGITFPTDFKEYVNLQRRATSTYIRGQSRLSPQYSSAIMTLYTNKNNPSFRVKFVDLFPTSLSSVLFSATDTAENIAIADATFRFSYYEYERIGPNSGRV
jgi:hypothetical protein